VSVTREQVLDALRGVPEPCSLAMRAPMDICEMGLVEDIEIESGQVRVTLVLTDPSCVHFTGMRRFIEDELRPLEGVTGVTVAMSTRTLWTPDRVRRRAPAPS
jgi:metal-sulfur cluster biosynthetic enzyme